MGKNPSTTSSRVRPSPPPKRARSDPPSAAPRCDAAEDDECGAAFERWMAENGFAVDARLRLRRRTGAEGRGVFVAPGESVSRGTVLFRVPRRACLNRLTCSSAAARASLQAAAAAGAASPVDQLIFALMAERALGAASPFAPYLAVLPPRVRHVPLFWSAAERRWLAGTELHDGPSEDAIAARYADIRAAVAAADPAGPFADDAVFSAAAYADAGSVVLAYAFSGSEDLTELVPMADMLNHRTGMNNARLYFDAQSVDVTLDSGGGEPPMSAPADAGAPGEEAYPMVATHTVGADAEMFNTYGVNLPSSSLLRDYGFCEAYNPFDVLSFSFGDLVRPLTADRADAPLASTAARAAVAARLRFLSSRPSLVHALFIGQGVSDLEDRWDADADALDELALFVFMFPESFRFEGVVRAVRFLTMSADEWDRCGAHSAAVLQNVPDDLRESVRAAIAFPDDAHVFPGGGGVAAVDESALSATLARACEGLGAQCLPWAELTAYRERAFANRGGVSQWNPSESSMGDDFDSLVPDSSEDGGARRDHTTVLSMLTPSGSSDSAVSGDDADHVDGGATAAHERQRLQSLGDANADDLADAVGRAESNSDEVSERYELTSDDAGGSAAYWVDVAFIEAAAFVDRLPPAASEALARWGLAAVAQARFDSYATLPAHADDALSEHRLGLARVLQAGERACLSYMVRTLVAPQDP